MEWTLINWSNPFIEVYFLLKSFRRKYGHFPPWNSIGGSTAGQTKVMENNINIVKSFCQPDNYAINPIVSRFVTHSS